MKYRIIPHGTRYWKVQYRVWPIWYDTPWCTFVSKEEARKSVAECIEDRRRAKEHQKQPPEYLEG